MNKKLITTMALVVAAVGSFAQSAVSSAGYEATGDGTVSATIGASCLPYGDERRRKHCAGRSAGL